MKGLNRLLFMVALVGMLLSSVSEARFFDSCSGRWTTRDPLEEAGDINLYRAMGNDAVNFVDPLGLQTVTNIDGFLRFRQQVLGWAPLWLQEMIMPIDDPIIIPLAGMAKGPSKYSGKKICEILKGKKGSVKNAPMPKGFPGWDKIQNMTWEELEAMLGDSEVWPTVKKLLTDNRFNK